MLTTKEKEAARNGTLCYSLPRPGYHDREPQWGNKKGKV